MPKKVKKLTVARKRKERKAWERALLREIRHRRARNSFAIARSRFHSGSREPALSVYPSLMGDLLPIGEFQNIPVPKWRYTNDWMKVNAGVWAMDERDERCLAFTINLHPDYEHQLKTATPPIDIRTIIRNRVSAELRKVITDELPTFFFVMEGRTKDRRATVPLHIHGALWANDPSKDDAIRFGLKRACGHYVKNRPKYRSAARLVVAYGLVDRWSIYCMKNIRIGDARLDRRRIAMSRPFIQAAEYWWGIVTGTAIDDD